MTGEMYHIDPVTGKEPDGTIWEYHAAIAKAVHGTIRPFDQYQGPYVVVGPDLRVGDAPYEVAPTHLGIIRLWLVAGVDDIPCVYREDTGKMSGPCFDAQEAAEAAIELMA